MRVILFLAALVLLADASSNHSFVISPDGKSFLKDGQKIQLVSGSIHYFRSSPSQWNARLSAARAAGLNAIQFYRGTFTAPPLASSTSLSGATSVAS